MRKKVNIERKIYFSSMVGEVCAISLEHDLHFVDDSDIEGNLIVSGRYKATVASQIEEDFSEKIPVEIAVTEKLDTASCKIDITDFNYDIVDSSNINCKIELSIEGDEILDEIRECDGDSIEKKEVEIPKKDDSKDDEMLEEIGSQEKKLENIKKEISEIEVINVPKPELPKITDTIREEEKENEVVEVNRDEEINAIEEVEKEEVTETLENDILFNIDNSNETYGTFIVYMIRQNETINSILEKYNTTLEEIEKYNEIKDLSIGTKLIIPIVNEKDK